MDVNFEHRKINGKNVVHCKICGNDLQNRANKRLEKHRERCFEVNENPMPPLRKRNRRAVDDDHSDVEENVNTRENIDNLLGQFLFACNIPFLTVESVHFKNFVTALNPDYKLPCRMTLSRSILDRIQEKMENERKEKLNEKNCVMVVDGWKNSPANSKYVVCTIHNIGDSSYFLKAYDLTGTSETGEELARIINNAIRFAKDNYNTNVIAVVSDNDSAMVKMGKLIDQWHVTCNSHSGNLLAKSLVDKEITSQVVKILKCFKDSALEKKLVERGGSRIKLPFDVRWCSYRDAFRCLIKNIGLMRQIADEDPLKTAEVHELLEDHNFETLVCDSIVIYDPACEIVNTCQKMSTDLAHAVECWLKLDFPTVSDVHDNILGKRKSKVIKPIGLAANLLHPVFKGARFLENLTCRNMALNFITSNLPDNAMGELQDYLDNEGFFQVLFSKNMTSNQAFWKMSLNHYPNLSTLALKLSLIPASSAQIERLFSNWSYVHSKIRNRLTFERSAKLIDIYFTLRVKDGEYNYGVEEIANELLNM